MFACRCPFIPPPDWIPQHLQVVWLPKPDQEVMVGWTSAHLLLAGQCSREPVQALVEAVAGGGAGAL
eukprot:CAMPEP_0206556548 /NCGR_PEP_ID=MMETSP0325_2-20121206/18516_1 /ASSEMBLY_ACC=CAM_ASM_000347 /TAXON_ID=2866 /ORGANISM="Crypthecodinium cohnii, Strain Seligo" /LENGTH=66 /DNA_ID=CAMNT_0054057183 /DNA_START=13 /DNA_END=210 /DNA_ORIENTATION=-